MLARVPAPSRPGDVNGRGLENNYPQEGVSVTIYHRTKVLARQDREQDGLCADPRSFRGQR